MMPYSWIARIELAWSIQLIGKLIELNSIDFYQFSYCLLILVMFCNDCDSINAYPDSFVWCIIFVIFTVYFKTWHTVLQLVPDDKSSDPMDPSVGSCCIRVPTCNDMQFNGCVKHISMVSALLWHEHWIVLKLCAVTVL